MPTTFRFFERRACGMDRESLAQPCVVATGGRALAPSGQAATASSGVAGGVIALVEARAFSRLEAGGRIVLVRRDAEKNDFVALERAVGLLTPRGARTSHAAVVAEGKGRDVWCRLFGPHA